MFNSLIWRILIDYDFHFEKPIIPGLTPSYAYNIISKYMGNFNGIFLKT